MPALLSDEHSADEAVSFPENSLTKHVVPGISVAGKSSRHRVRKESGMDFFRCKFFWNLCCP